MSTKNQVAVENFVSKVFIYMDFYIDRYDMTWYIIYIHIHIYLPYDSANPESCKKNVPCNLAKRILFFVTDPEKVELTLNELRIWLKNNNYPDHIISNAFYNAKLQGPAPKPKNNSNNIPSVTYFHQDTDNKIIMKNI